MKRNIFEELPARKFASVGMKSDASKKSTGPSSNRGPSSNKGLGSSGGPSSGRGPSSNKGPKKGAAPGSTIDDERKRKIRQAIYDIRYRARREGIDVKVAYSQYMQNSSMSEQDRAEVRASLFDEPEDQTQNEGFNPYELFLDFLVSEGYAYSYRDAANIMGDLDETYVNEIIDYLIEQITGVEDNDYYIDENDLYEEIFSDIYENSLELTTNALKKVFVEDQIIDEEYLEELKKDYVKNELGRISRGAGNRKYKVRVCDSQSGICYSRFATREKITQLRGRGLNVEMSEHGDAYEGGEEEKQQKSKTLGKIDKSKKAKKDYDGDGKVESSFKEYRGSVHNAIQRKKGGIPDGKDTSNVKENYFIETIHPTKYQNKKKINPSKVENKITIFPDDKTSGRLVVSDYKMNGNLIPEMAVSPGQQKLFGMVRAAQQGEPPASPKIAKLAKTVSPIEAKKFASTKHKDMPQKVAKEETTFTEPKEIPSFGIDQEETFGVGKKSCGSGKKNDEVKEVDPRTMKTSSNLLKTKLRYYGVRI